VTRSRGGRLVAAALVIASVAACGKRGSPQAPIRRSPARVADLEARRIEDRIELRFTIPGTNSDGSTPPTVERVEIYRLALPAAAGPPSIAQVVAPGNLDRTITVRPPESPGTPAPKTPDTRPAAGEPTTVVEKLAADKAAADTSVAHYVVVGLTGRRKGPTSPIVSVPLGPLPAAPTNFQPTYDEKTLTLAWTPSVADEKFRVYLVPDQKKPDERTLLTAEPLSAPTFATPVQLGKEQCYTITPVIAAGKATIEGAGLGPACWTAADRFPPPVPQKLRAQLNDAVVLLDWVPVDVPDLAGYIVLRTDGTSDTLQPLTREPIAENTYEDKTVQPGMTYTYVVVAVDKATPPNRSQPSEKQVVVVR
jgi:hypothetical protein